MRDGKAETSFQLILKSALCNLPVVHLQQGSLILTLELRAVRMAGNYVFTYLTVSTDSKVKGAGGEHF